jgi:uncharacterized phiE125 gp8 family phage protein
MYSLRVITPPTAEPVTLAETRTHLRVTHSYHDSLIAGYIFTARQWIEDVTGRAFLTKTLEMTMDAFPWDGVILLPRTPVASISSVKYVDGAGVLQTIDSADYQLDANTIPSRLVPAYEKSWPTPRGTVGCVQVRFVAGGTDMPWPLRQAILLHVEGQYDPEQRDKNMQAVDSLISPYKVHTF